MSEQAILLWGACALGAILGSFLNALLFRFNTGTSILHGRSRCMQCNRTLEARDLVPVFSFLWLRGKCRYCGSRLSLQYPLVEILAAALSVLVYLVHPEPLAYAFWLLVWMTLLFVVVYDIRHTIIPWSCSILLVLLGVASLFISFDLPGQAGLLVHFNTLSLWSALSGPLLALPLFFISLVSLGRWMGWGDSALELALGWLLGLGPGATALMLAFWSGALVGVLLLLIQKLFALLTPTQTSHKFLGGLTIKSEVPFAPFLILGAALVHFCHVDFFQTISLLW